jgi:Zn-dependent protease with chaperone function
MILGLAFGIRLGGTRLAPRWTTTIMALSLPGLLLLSSAVAILRMGHHGEMWGLPVDAGACVVAKIGLGWAGFQGIRVLYQTWRLHRWLKTLPVISHPDLPPEVMVHYLNVPQVMAAQVGFFRSRLLVSQGLLALPSAHRRAVFAHEQAHFTYRDPLWTLALSWLQGMTLGLPGTQQLWEDLLLLREYRADAAAALTVDPLVLAETLVVTVRSTLQRRESGNMALSTPAWVGLHSATERLECRVQALIEGHVPNSHPLQSWGFALGGTLLGMLPLGTIAFHHMVM